MQIKITSVHTTTFRLIISMHYGPMEIPIYLEERGMGAPRRIYAKKNENKNGKTP